MNKYQLFQKAGDRLVFIIDRLFLPHYCLRDHILTDYIWMQYKFPMYTCF